MSATVLWFHRINLKINKHPKKEWNADAAAAATGGKEWIVATATAPEATTPNNISTNKSFNHNKDHETNRWFWLYALAQGMAFEI